MGRHPSRAARCWILCAKTSAQHTDAHTCTSPTHHHLCEPTPLHTDQVSARPHAKGVVVVAAVVIAGGLLAHGAGLVVHPIQIKGALVFQKGTCTHTHTHTHSHTHTHTYTPYHTSEPTPDTDLHISQLEHKPHTTHQSPLTTTHYTRPLGVSCTHPLHS